VLRHAPERIPDVFEGAPLVAAVAVRAEGGELVVRGQAAHEVWEQTIRVPACAAGAGNQAIVALYGRERVADVEANALFRTVDGEVEELGLTFSIATRMTSWVAIDEASKVTGPSRDQLIPQELPYGTSAAAFGLRGSTPQMQVSTMAGAMPARMMSVHAPASFDSSDEVDEEYGDVTPSAPSMSLGAPTFDDVDELAPAAPRARPEAKKEAAAFEEEAFEEEQPTGEVYAPAEQAAPARKVSSVPRAGASRPMRTHAVTDADAFIAEPRPEPSAPAAKPTIGVAPKTTEPRAQMKRRSSISLGVWLVLLLALIAFLVWWLAA
jgi:Ca-activated chloride channel family protein